MRQNPKIMQLVTAMKSNDDYTNLKHVVNAINNTVRNSFKSMPGSVGAIVKTIAAFEPKIPLLSFFKKLNLQCKAIETDVRYRTLIAKLKQQARFSSALATGTDESKTVVVRQQPPRGVQHALAAMQQMMTQRSGNPMAVLQKAVMTQAKIAADVTEKIEEAKQSFTEEKSRPLTRAENRNIKGTTALLLAVLIAAGVKLLVEAGRFVADGVDLLRVPARSVINNGVAADTLTLLCVGTLVYLLTEKLAPQATSVYRNANATFAVLREHKPSEDTGEATPAPANGQ